MEAGRQNMEEMRAKRSWMPETPVKNGFDRQPPFWSYLGQEGQEPDQAVCDNAMKISLAGRSIGASAVSAMEELSGINVPFKTLMAMAESGSASGNGTTLVRTQLLHSDLTNYDHRPVLDLNLSGESMEEAFYSKSTCQFAPITPEKPVMRDQSGVARRQSFYMNDKPNEELNRPESESAAAEVLINVLQKDKTSQNSATDSNLAANSPPSENHGPVKDDAVNPVKTPQQKPRRKKHRPKLITEGKPRPRKQATAKPVGSKEKPAVKRKYVRKNACNKTSTTPIEEVNKEATDQTIPEPAKKSCKRSLNFDTEGEPKDDCINRMPWTEREPQDNAGGNQSKLTVHLSQGIEVIVNNTQCGIPCDFDYPVSKLIQDFSSPAENQVAGTQAKAPDIPPESGHIHTFKSIDLENVLSEEQHLLRMKSQSHSKLPPSLPKGLNCCTGATFRTEQTAKDPKSIYIASSQQSNIFSTNSVGTSYNSLFAYSNGEFWGQYQRRKRTENVQRATSTTAASFVQQHQHAEKPSTALDGKVPNSGFYTLNESCAISPPSWKDKLPRQKSRSQPTSTQNIASMADGACFHTRAAYSAGQLLEYCDAEQVGNSHGHQPFVKDIAKFIKYTYARKRRTKNQGSLVNFAPSCRIEEHPSGNILYKQDNFSSKTSGIQVEAARKKLAVDESAKESVQLDIIEGTPDIEYTEQNALVPYSFANEQNSLVLYRQDGTLVPYYNAFTPIKKRPRPKVDLDDETNRVWNLLMGNINSEGTDGTNPETAKRWEEDRNVFHGRALSFIARMHLVQGDRRFTPWKGSVVDSVIGVFLTQNVSDHLSSSAFMSLAARFPANSNRKFKQCHDGDISSEIDKPILCMVDPETAKSNEMLYHSISDQSSMTFHCIEFDEEKESVNGEELSRSCTSIINSQNSIETSGESFKNISNRVVTEMGQTYSAGNRKGPSDILSCQISSISSQNSIDSPINQAAERGELFSENNLQTMDRIGGHMKGSFLELLQKAEATTLSDYSMGNAPSMIFQNQCNCTENTENDLQSQQMEILDRLRSSSEGSAVPSNDCHVHSSTFEVKEIEDLQMITEEARYYHISEDKGIHVTNDYTTSTEESANHFSYHDKLNINVQEASKLPFVHDPSFNSALKGSSITMVESRQTEDPKIIPESLSQARNSEKPQNVLFSNHAPDAAESSSEFNEQGKNPSKISSQSKGKEFQDMDAAKRKAKIRRVGNDIRDNVDWDALKRETEAKSDKRERTADTMDSVDWEAVRRANVDEIAETIKERGMNNILAGRIKEFLNRMVREHGNIDLEWLRDIEPDTAKEYLLSVRGLGLKSVECVRLLTLHHLAFPVDTNVARIAVRLGWVPLQPLPESLQLHLLELYPVMESIQKYLWPRLYKLDQKTLYEFHYQLITFGKVFCTKGKPNCNACPMRGECRHFASAYASARLSLPAPEEQGIVSTTEKTEQHPPKVVNPLFLPPPMETQQLKDNEKPEANQLLDIQFKVSNCKPIIEEPSSPEPQHTPVMEDIEDMFLDDPDEIPTIKLNVEEFSQNLQDFMQQNMELQEGDMSKALVALTEGAASIPTPKLKNVSRLRTEHHVYELPDSHPLLQEMDSRETDDPSPYLLAIWTPGETANSFQPPEGNCGAQEYGKLCDEKTCYSCNSKREENSNIVRGTLLIPCRTAMRGSFPLNGTYFQVNEVFADHDSSLKPIDVPRSWIWNLPRRTVYFGTSVPSIFRGLTTEEIQHCFWRGYVCVRGFDRKTRAPRPLMARLHFPVSKLPKNKEKITSKQKKT